MKFKFGQKTVKVSGKKVLKVTWASMCLLVIISMMASGFAGSF